MQNAQLFGLDDVRCETRRGGLPEQLRRREVLRGMQLPRRKFTVLLGVLLFRCRDFDYSAEVPVPQSLTCWPLACAALGSTRRR